MHELCRKVKKTSIRTRIQGRRRTKANRTVGSGLLCFRTFPMSDTTGSARSGMATNAMDDGERYGPAWCTRSVLR